MRNILEEFISRRMSRVFLLMAYKLTISSFSAGSQYPIDGMEDLISGVYGLNLGISFNYAMI